MRSRGVTRSGRGGCRVWSEPGYRWWGWLANVGLANLIDEFEAADLGWLAGALALSPVVPVAQAVATLGASFRPLRFGSVVMLEYAIQFIALALPSSAARLALDIRFFGRNGIEGGAAISIGVVASVCGFITQVLLILVISLSGSRPLTWEGAARPRHPRPATRPRPADTRC